MKTVYYKKVGRRYEPVSEYDSDYLDSFPKGSHLVMVYPGGSSRRYHIDPALAPMIAAGRVAEDAISKSIMAAQELRLPARQRERPLTPEQKAAWDHLVAVFGDSVRQLEWPSVREAAEAGVKAMMEEQAKLLNNPIVRQAYERFLFIAELAGKTNGTDSN